MKVLVVGPAMALVIGLVVELVLGQLMELVTGLAERLAVGLAGGPLQPPSLPLSIAADSAELPSFAAAAAAPAATQPFTKV